MITTADAQAMLRALDENTRAVRRLHAALETNTRARIDAAEALRAYQTAPNPNPQPAPAQHPKSVMPAAGRPIAHRPAAQPAAAPVHSGAPDWSGLEWQQTKAGDGWTAEYPLQVDEAGKPLRLLCKQNKHGWGAVAFGAGAIVAPPSWVNGATPAECVGSLVGALESNAAGLPF